MHILYGSTEVEPIAHLLARDMPADSRAGGVCVGRIAEGLRHKLIRPQDGPLRLDSGGWASHLSADGEVGELIVSGEHVCRDYYKDPEAFARAKIVDADETVWHRTGDLCRFDAEGRLWFAGRVHSAIRRAGRILVPVEAEVLMNRLPFVEAAAYLGLPDETLGERAVAAFSVKPAVGGRDFADDVREALEGAGLVVDDVVQVPEIPLDPRHHSKVEYARLREMLTAAGGEG